MLNTKFFKILNKDRNHNGFQYKLGLNILPQGEFARTGLCIPGGFYYTTIKHILKFVDYGEDLFEVTIPSDAQIRKIGNKFRIDKIILGNHYSLFDISTYKMLKEMGIDINTNKCTNFSAKHGLIHLFNFFVESNTNPDYLMALFQAIEHGQLSFIKIIIDKTTDYFNYALFLCSKYGHLNIMEFLVEKNPNYIYDHEYNCSPILCAIEHNHLDIVKYLIKKYPEGYSFDLILNIASQRNHQDIFKYIATELSNESNYQLIMLLASKRGYLDIIQQFNGLVDYRNFIEYASIAAAFGHLPVLKYFVDSGTNIIDIINCGKYDVFEIAHCRPDGVVKYLIENTVGKINHIDAYTKYVMKSAGACNTEIFELVLNILIKDNADINHIFSENSYKLMNCISILELAISHGFQPKIDDLSLAVKRAISKQDLLLVEYLIKLGAVPELSPDDFKNACINDNLSMAKLLVKNCVILEKDRYEFIIIASQHNYMNIIKYWIKKFTPSSDIYTELLRKCVICSNLDIIKLFVDLGANIDTEIITKAIKYGHLDAIEYFVERGIVITNELIDCAINEGYDNIAKYFREKLIL